LLDPELILLNKKQNIDCWD